MAGIHSTKNNLKMARYNWVAWMKCTTSFNIKKIAKNIF
jgi:hypothetical protein